MTKVSDIVDIIEKLAPPDTAEGFDNVGLLIGNKERTVHKVMIMLDADSKTVEEAVNLGCDMIITHHPVIFSPLKKINDSKILKLIENRISLYSAHTSLDSAEGGVNTCLANKLGLYNTETVSPEAESPFRTKTGFVDECTLKEFLKTVKESLGIKNLRYVGDENKIIKKVGVCGGSGASFMAFMKKCRCDAYVTADIKYHDAQVAFESDIAIIDAGHFETENPVCMALAEYIGKHISDVEIVISERNSSYIKYE